MFAAVAAAVVVCVVAATAEALGSEEDEPSREGCGGLWL